MLSSHNDPFQATTNLQNALEAFERWTTTWRIKINENKSTSITFTLRKINPRPVTFNGKRIPYKEDVKYLGIYLDSKLTWKTHIKTKRKELDIRVKKMYWLLGRKSQLSLTNKVLLYKTIIVPIWTYGIQFWGCAKSSNIEILQRFQSKTLRAMVNAEWYVNNRIIHNDLKIPWIKDVIKDFCSRYETRISDHPSVLVTDLLNRVNVTRRLKRTKFSDLTN